MKSYYTETSARRVQNHTSSQHIVSPSLLRARACRPLAGLVPATWGSAEESTPRHGHHPRHPCHRHGGHGNGVEGGENLQAAIACVPHHQAQTRHQRQR
jgi:hypothetical protein